MVTYPTISSILPNEIFEGTEVVQKSIEEIDRTLADSHAGAYIVTIVERKE